MKISRVEFMAETAPHTSLGGRLDLDYTYNVEFRCCLGFPALAFAVRINNDQADTANFLKQASDLENTLLSAIRWCARPMTALRIGFSSLVRSSA